MSLSKTARSTNWCISAENGIFDFMGCRGRRSELWKGMGKMRIQICAR